MIYNSNLYDFFGMNNESVRSSYKSLMSVFYIPEIRNGTIVPAHQDQLPGGSKMITQPAYTVKEISDVESRDRIFFGVSCVIAIILFAILCWLIYDTYIKEEKQPEPSVHS